jgi:hypothetical protein
VDQRVDAERALLRLRDKCSCSFLWSMVKRPQEEPGANTLMGPSPPPHGNFPGPLPTVYHGPYEYSSPLVAEDYLPQTRRVEGHAGHGAH